MIDDVNNNSPKAPDGLVGNEGFEGLNKKSQKPSKNIPSWISLVWLVVGVLLSTVSNGLSVLCVSAGLLHLSKSKSFVWQLGAAILCFVASLALAWNNLIEVLPSQVAVSLISFLIPLAYTQKRFTWRVLTLVALLCAAISLCGDYFVALSEHTTLSAAIDAFITEYQSSASSLADSSIALEMTAVATTLRLYWPLAYVLNTAVLAFLAILGVKFVSLTLKERYKALNGGKIRFGIFTLVIYIISATAQILGPHAPMYSSEIVFGATNIFLIARCLEFLAGYSLVVFYIKRNKLPRILSVIALFMLLYLEASFFIVSAIGLVDVLADFRKNLFTKAKEDRG